MRTGAAYPQLLRNQLQYFKHGIICIRHTLVVMRQSSETVHSAFIHSIYYSIAACLHSDHITSVLVTVPCEGEQSGQHDVQAYTTGPVMQGGQVSAAGHASVGVALGWSPKGTM